MTLKKTKCHFYCRASLCFYGRVVGRELVTKKPGQNYVMAYPNQGLKVFGNSRPVSVSEVQRGEGGRVRKRGSFTLISAGNSFSCKCEIILALNNEMKEAKCSY